MWTLKKEILDRQLVGLIGSMVWKIAKWNYLQVNLNSNIKRNVYSCTLQNVSISSSAVNSQSTLNIISNEQITKLELRDTVFSEFLQLISSKEEMWNQILQIHVQSTSLYKQVTQLNLNFIL